MEPKKLFLISIIVLVVLLGALLVYNFALKDRDKQDPEIRPEGQDEQETGPIINISQEPVISPILDTEKELVKYYNAQDGIAFSTDFNGQDKKEISDSPLSGFIKALWSPDTTSVIGLFANFNNGPVKKAYYNYKSEKSSVLNENIAWINWSPEGDKIVYEYLGPNNNNNISIADPNGDNWQEIFQTRVPDWQIEWITENKISLATPPSSESQGVVYQLDPKTQEFSKVLSDYFGLKPLWSPRGDKLIFSATNNQTGAPSLWISDKDGENRKELVIETIVDKCTWSDSNNVVFCAVPKSLNTGYKWPDDYYKGLVSTKDNFYQINFDTGQQVQLFISSDSDFYDASNLMLDNNEDYLFFFNEYDSQLYRLDLKS